jgi:MFS family permease
MTSDTAGVSQTLPMGIRLRLSLMMFLQFFVWGAWFVTMGTFLGVGLSASGSQISLAYLTQSLGAILAPLIIGLIADQFFSAQKSLACCTLAAPFCCGSLVTFRSSACSSR